MTEIVSPTDAELAYRRKQVPNLTVEQARINQEELDSRRIIALGRAGGDTAMIAIGQKRLRIALGKLSPEDLVD